MIPFKSYLIEMSKLTTGGKTALRGNANEVFATSALKYHLAKKSVSGIKQAISRSLFGTKQTKAPGLRIRGVQLNNPVHPYGKIKTAIGEDETRKLFRTGLHTGSAIAHFVTHHYGDITDVKHVGLDTMGGGKGVKTSTGEQVKTPADIVVTSKQGGKLKILGKSLKLASSSSGARTTKAYSPSHVTLAKILDEAHEKIHGVKYSGAGLHDTINRVLNNHTDRESAVYKKHHEFLSGTFGVNTLSKRERSGKMVPTKYSPGADATLNSGALKHIRELVDRGHPQAKAFYDDLNKSNQKVQSELAYHFHHASKAIFTNISTPQHRKIANQAYRRLNNTGDSAIKSVIVSTDESKGGKRPVVNVYDHSTTVDHDLGQMKENGKDFEVAHNEGTAAFKIGGLKFGVDKRAGEGNRIMVNATVNNSKLHPVATYTDHPTEPHHIAWNALRTKE